MSKYRKSARGQDCLVRIEGICNFNPETVVLAHLNGAGMGIKASEIHGAFCCSSCHDELDGRTNFRKLEYATKRLMHYEGIKRTQEYWIKNGILKI